VRFYYTGYLASGVVFDSNVGEPQPLEYGLGELIAGFNSGLQGMQVGGRRRLVIPSALAYGPASQGVIPPNANLVFDVHLVGVL
jgi:FKBP-type peptidyl-prolyl cis-trans isomerase